MYAKVGIMIWPRQLRAFWAHRCAGASLHPWCCGKTSSIVVRPSATSRQAIFAEIAHAILDGDLRISCDGARLEDQRADFIVAEHQLENTGSPAIAGVLAIAAARPL